MITKPLSTFMKDNKIFIATLGNIQSDYHQGIHEWLNFNPPMEVTIIRDSINFYGLQDFKPSTKGFVGGKLIFETSNKLLYSLEIIKSDNIEKPIVIYEDGLLIGDNLEEVTARFELEALKLFERLKVINTTSFVAFKQRLRETPSFISELYPEKLI